MRRSTKLIPPEDERAIDLLPSPGYRFVPTDQELIRYYLRPRVARRSLPRWNVITDRDVYRDEEPAEIFEGRWASEMYFFTPIKKKKHWNSVDRVIPGKGAWRAEGSKEVYEQSGRKLIGFKTSLTFVSSRSSSGGGWVMHEYTLCDDDQSVALCRIKRGRANTTDGGGGEVLMTEEEEDNIELAKMAALHKMSTRRRAKLDKGKTSGEIQPVQVQQLSQESSSDNPASVEASESDDDYQPEVNAPTSKDKGKAVSVYSDHEPSYLGSPKRYKRRLDVLNKIWATKSSNVPATKADTGKDRSRFDGPSRPRESLSPSSIPKQTLDIVNADYNRDILSKADPTFISSKAPFPDLQNDAHNVKGMSSSEDLVQVIMNEHDKIQLAGIAFSSKYHSLEEQCENLRSHCAELESELAKMKKELSDKDMVILQKSWENQTLHDVLKNEKASFKRRFEDMTAFLRKDS